MIVGSIIETRRLNDGTFQALDNLGNITKFSSLRKNVNYFSPTLERYGLYNSKYRTNLSSAKVFFTGNIKRNYGLVIGGKPFLLNKVGLYPDITYFDFKHFYANIAMQIANHIDEDYKPKPITTIVKRKEFIKSVEGISKEAQKAKLYKIEDFSSAVSIDKNDKSAYIEKIKDLSEENNYYDKADAVVSKIIRNALSFGFGYQQKHARISNISVTVFYLARKFMEAFINEISKKYEVVFSHTDSFMTTYVNTKDIEDAVREATGIIDNKFFGNTGIFSFGLKDIGIKNKFEELRILNQNSYIYSVVAQRGKREIGLAISGLNTLNTCDLGINKKGESINEILSEHSEEIIKLDSNFLKDYADMEFIYGVLKYRISDDYRSKLIDKWENNKPMQEAVIISKTIGSIRNYATNSNIVSIAKFR